MRLRAAFRAAAHSRVTLVVAVLLSLAVPLLTMPRLSLVSLWPVLLALIPWVVGKYLLCPLRWRALTDAGLARGWHVRAYAESELVGLLTPGHVGADVWRMHRLTAVGLRRRGRRGHVGLDRFVGAIGLAVFVSFAGSALPTQMLVVALGVGVLVLATVLVVRRVRPEWLPTRPLPPPRRLGYGLLLSALYQLTIAGLLCGAVAATGHTLSPLAPRLPRARLRREV